MKPADLQLHPHSISTLLLWKQTPTAVIGAVVRDNRIVLAEFKDRTPHGSFFPVAAIQELLDQGYLSATVSTEVKPGLRNVTYVLSGAGRVIMGALEETDWWDAEYQATLFSDEGDKEELGNDE